MEVPEPELDDDPDGQDDVEGDHKWHFRYNRRLGMFSNPIASLNFSADGKWFLAGTAAGDVKVWETTRWSEAARLKCVQRQEPRAIVISPTQRWLVAAYPSVLQIFACRPPWRLEQAIPAMPDPVTGDDTEWYCIAFSPGMAEVDHPGGTTGHDYYLAGFSTCHMAVMDYSGGWKPDTPKRTRTISHSTKPTSLAYTADGWWLVCGFECGQLQVWNAFSLTLERTLVSHTGRVNDITTSPRCAAFESRFVSCGVDQTLRVWHTAGWILEQICPDTKADRNGITSCTFSSTGNWFLSVANELVVWRACVTRRGKMILRIHQRIADACGSEELRAAAFCSLNDAIAVGSKDGVLALWTKAEGLPPELSPSKRGSIFDPKMSSLGGLGGGGNEPWSFDRQSLPRPMKRITPDGVQPLATMSGRVECTRRMPLRSLSSVSLSAVSGVNSRSNAVVSNSPSAGQKNGLGSPAGSRFRAKSIGENLEDGIPGPHGLAVIRSVSRATSTTPSLERSWTSGRFDDVLSTLDGMGAVDRRPHTGHCGARRRSDPEPLSHSLGELLEEASPMQRTIQHVCRGMVQRISLAPQVIMTDNGSRSSSKSSFASP